MPGEILTALSDTGSQLAVIDITHPAFSIPFSDEELAGMETKYLQEAVPTAELLEPMRQALRSSALGSALMASSGTYLAGLPTYTLKLGPENFGPDAALIDKRIAASFPAVCVRFRLADMASLMASGLSQLTRQQPEKPLCLINLGGGAAADSWNALILLHRHDPGLLARKAITIAVIDTDSNGPSFGSRAVQALCEPNQPLAGHDIDFRHFNHGWADLDRLHDTLAEIRATEAVCVISSEGALFEYGSDREIVSTITALHAGTPSGTFIVGSVTRECECTRLSRMATQAAIQPRTLEAFAGLAADAGWRLQEPITRPFSFHVRLEKS